MNQPPRHPGLEPGPSVKTVIPSTDRWAWTPGQARGDEVNGGKLKHHLGLAALLALTACGKAAGLAPAPGQQLPVAPLGAKATPTPADLLTPTTQQRPQRGDELLRSSQERRSDEFDLPPQ